MLITEPRGHYAHGAGVGMHTESPVIRNSDLPRVSTTRATFGEFMSIFEIKILVTSFVLFLFLKGVLELFVEAYSSFFSVFF